MKLFAMVNIFRLTLLIMCGFNFGIAHADVSKKSGLNLPLSSEWGEPVFNQHTILDEVNEWRWRYTRKNSTLIIIQAECEKCKPITQQEVDEYNSRAAQTTGKNSALLLNYRGIPAMLRIHASHKNVNLRIFQINTNGFYYKIQLGVNSSATQDFSFKLENEFMEMVNGFVPQPLISH
ncbi:MAG: hypothetical protein L3J98_08630 [Gammaproteobacteria bacterium]|nr:hypothetical protein [Gammaproteobacteria bacterium]MCF6260210.1 hypothetical protein [Gammaproteobacteria bacterium]